MLTSAGQDQCPQSLGAESCALKWKRLQCLSRGRDGEGGAPASDWLLQILSSLPHPSHNCTTVHHLLR
jgi:hypothetical protein